MPVGILTLCFRSRSERLLRDFINLDNTNIQKLSIWKKNQN